MLKTLKNKKAEGYIDTAVSVMILAFVLIFSVSVISVVVLNQNMKAIADQIVDYATFKGTTAIDSYIEGIKTERGLSFTHSFAGTEWYKSDGRVQLGDEIVCELTYNISILGFGEFVFPITVQTSSSGISQVYWK